MKTHSYGIYLAIFSFVAATGCSTDRRNATEKIGASDDAAQTHGDGGSIAETPGNTSSDASTSGESMAAEDGGDAVGMDATVKSESGVPTVESQEPTSCLNAGCNINAACDNSDGKVKCYCLAGYDGDGKNCWDINECADPKLNTCAKDAACANTEGGFVCTCSKGFKGDGTSCADIDECSVRSLHGCDPNALCANTPGGFSCRCPEGFVGDGKTCTDVNECEGATNTCNSKATCVNTAPGFRCDCNPGYSGDGFNCEDVDECPNPALYTCSSNATCKNTVGGYGCDCNPGFEGNGKTCTDSNECLGKNENAVCHLDADCTNIDGAFSCKCQPGYIGGGYATGDKAGCEDVDECANGSTNSCPVFTYCVNTRGSYRCECSPGFVLGSDGKTCTDSNECLGMGTSAVCHLDAECTNSEGDFSCQCKPGYTGGGYATGTKAGCEDVDECASALLNGCPAFTYCVNTRGGYRCDCSPGFALAGDGVTCTDVNECLGTGTDAVCHADADCTNTNGSYSCTCKSGFAGGGYATGTNAGCTDVDECATNGAYSCQTNSHCVNSRGGVPGYTCPCDTGLGLDKAGKCVPLCDIALVDSTKCGANARCHIDSASGEAVCTDCNEGYTGNGMTCVQYCRDIQGNYLCGLNTTCNVTNNGATANCACEPGYEGNASSSTGCTDINECTQATHTCACNSADNCTDPSRLTYCVNNAGGFTCNCKAGYQKDQNGACVDINECTSGTAGCDANATCTNQTPGFACTCKSGYSGSGTSCTDINECTAGTDTCNDSTQDCVNTTGSFTCNCKTGYQNQNGACVNINECTAGTASCDPNATCTDLTPGYSCACKVGYSGSGTTCIDVNECTAGTDTCNDATQDCANNAGGFACNCKGGYQNQNGTCVNINECTAGTASCDPNATCTDLTPGYSCACKVGYSGSGTTCIDVNECTAGTDTCNDATQDCVNSTGSFTCNCKTGYQNQNGACVNINECTAGGHNCDTNATCTDQTPGFQCVCKSGYSGSGTSCADVNECSTGAHNCYLQVSTCENIKGAFNCKNINECQSGASKTHDCSNYATCTDIDCETDANNSCTNQSAAGFSCGCNAGFGGNGHGKDGCYCDLSGYWAVRQLGNSEAVSNYPITIDALKYHVWEINRFEYDGKTLKGYRKSCGQDLWPEVHVSIIDEIYSTYIPIDANDQQSLVKSYEFSRAAITPANGSFNTPTEVALTGLTLNDPMNDPWPTDHTKILWVDSDNDGEPGYTLAAAGTTKATRTHPDKTFVYVPTAATVPVNRRAACWSGAGRVKAHYEVQSVNAACNVLTGTIVNEKTEGHIRTCTIVPKGQWENTDIKCDQAYWSSSVERCNSSEVTTIDNETHAPGTDGVTVTFKAVKVGNSEPTCPYVRSYNFDQ